MPNGTYGGVRGRKTKVGRKLSFSSYSIIISKLDVTFRESCPFLLLFSIFVVKNFVH